jgi:hypothetical protein
MQNFKASGQIPISEDTKTSMLKAMGPGLPSQMVNQAAACVWLLLPADRRTPEEIASALHAMVDRAVVALKEDEHFFGKSNPLPSAQKE